jgi:hypothetical protein
MNLAGCGGGYIFFKSEDVFCCSFAGSQLSCSRAFVAVDTDVSGYPPGRLKGKEIEGLLFKHLNLKCKNH